MATAPACVGGGMNARRALRTNNRTSFSLSKEAGSDPRGSVMSPEDLGSSGSRGRGVGQRLPGPGRGRWGQCFVGTVSLLQDEEVLEVGCAVM